VESRNGARRQETIDLGKKSPTFGKGWLESGDLPIFEAKSAKEYNGYTGEELPTGGEKGGLKSGGGTETRFERWSEGGEDLDETGGAGRNGGA